MTVLNKANNIILGLALADRVYLGTAMVWDRGISIRRVTYGKLTEGFPDYQELSAAYPTYADMPKPIPYAELETKYLTYAALSANEPTYQNLVEL